MIDMNFKLWNQNFTWYIRMGLHFTWLFPLLSDKHAFFPSKLLHKYIINIGMKCSFSLCNLHSRNEYCFFALSSGLGSMVSQHCVILNSISSLLSLYCAFGQTIYAQFSLHFLMYFLDLYLLEISSIPASKWNSYVISLEMQDRL